MARYDKIGKTYNQTRKADPYITSRLLHHLNPTLNGTYLDIGCGSGNYTNEFKKKGYNFIGIDPSEEMLGKARQKNPNIEWRIGTAETLELPKHSIDGVLATLTIHHWQDLNKSFRNISHAMKPEASFVILTATPEQMDHYWLRHYFPKMIHDSKQLMPSLEMFSEAMKKSAVQLYTTEKYEVQSDLQDLFLNAGKSNPSLYLQPEVRAGISSFAAVAHKAEVDKGLKKLKKDIEQGTITEVIASYENKLGDYLFIVGKKQD